MKPLRNMAWIAILIPLQALADPGLDEAIVRLQHEWAIVNYRTPAEKQEAAFDTLAGMAQDVAQRYPGKAEPMVWKAIILASEAKVKGGFSALGLARNARNLLLEAERIDPAVLHGSIYTSLGSLYYKVPGWPIGFGDRKKAEKYLLRALELNPEGIDANYFYGDLMLQESKYDLAIEYLNKALSAPARPGREIADRGRREEIQVDLKRAQESR